jgi:hypothetical protein
MAVSQITQEHVNELQGFLDNGDRGGFYWRLFELTDSNQILIQGQISTYSGAWGGLALSGNYLAKLQDQENYTLTLDDFSTRIAQGTLDSIVRNIGEGGTGLLSDIDFVISDSSVWEANGLQEHFPGHVLLLQELDTIQQFPELAFSQGTLNSLVLGSFDSIDNGVSVATAIVGDNALASALNGVSQTAVEFGLPFIGVNGETYFPHQLGLRYNDFSEDEFIRTTSDDGRFLLVEERATGHIVFIQDTMPPGVFGELGFEEADFFDSLPENSPAFQIRESLFTYLQANQSEGAATPFIPNQVPPNVFFGHRLDNGVTIGSEQLLHQEILDRIQGLDSSNINLSLLEREELIQAYSNQGALFETETVDGVLDTFVNAASTVVTGENVPDIDVPLYGSTGIENFLLAMERLFLGVETPVPLTTEAGYVSRATAVLDHLDSLVADGELGLILDLTESGADALVVEAQRNNNVGLAIRYALEGLNPFAIVTNQPIYNIHNQSGELNLDNLTDEYLQDRAEFLVNLTTANLQNTDSLIPSPGSALFPRTQYSDTTLDASVTVGGGINISYPRQVV